MSSFKDADTAIIAGICRELAAEACENAFVCAGLQHMRAGGVGPYEGLIGIIKALASCNKQMREQLTATVLHNQSEIDAARRQNMIERERLKVFNQATIAAAERDAIGILSATTTPADVGIDYATLTADLQAEKLAKHGVAITARVCGQCGGHSAGDAEACEHCGLPFPTILPAE